MGIINKILISGCLLATGMPRLSATTQWPITSGSSLTSVATISPTTSSQTSSSIPNGKAVYWTFSGTAGVTYYFDFLSSSSTQDMVMAVFDGLYSTSTSKLVAANDDYGLQVKSGLTFVCPATQTYYILAHTHTSPFTFPASAGATVVLTYYQCGSVTAASTPVTEDWSTSNVSTACTNWMAHGTGQEGDFWINNSGWRTYYGWPYGANLAGGSGSEVVLTGADYDIYGLGSVGNRTATLTSFPINTSGTNSMVYTWKQSLQTNGDAGINGSNMLTLKLQTSNDLVTWTDQWTGTYTIGSSATTQFNKVTTSVTINTTVNLTTWVRFYANGVIGKVSFWAIDDGNTGTIVLPIELETFAAKYFNSNVKLDWSTASETNNAQFVIERSANGQDFSFLTSVQGSGNSHVQRKYSTIDESPLPGISYYRLKQTDFNGKYSYSHIVSVTSDPESWLGRPYPNPATSEVNFTLNAAQDGIISIEMLDVTGRLVLSEDRPVRQGNQSVNVSMNSLAKGIYYFRVRDDEHGYSSAVKLTKE